MKWLAILMLTALPAGAADRNACLIFKDLQERALCSRFLESGIQAALASVPSSGTLATVPQAPLRAFVRAS